MQRDEKITNGRLNNREFSKALEERTRRFALEIIRLSGALPHTTEGGFVRQQITKSGTSIGANYCEANRSRSRADFQNRIRICESEASETLYRLNVIGDAEWLPFDRIRPVYNQCTELLALFTSICKSTKKGAGAQQ